MDLLEYLRSLCLKIVRNEIDHFELVAAAETVKVDINQELQFSYQKNQLKYAVLREILKSSSISEDEKKTFKVTFHRPRVSVPNFSFLACLEVAEKFVVGGDWVVVGGWVGGV